MRVLLAVHGSAGDLFPLLPIADSLAESGHEVTLAVPRYLGLHLRLSGRAHLVYGTSTQIADIGDHRLFTNRFAGWSSWRRLFEHHLAPTVRDDVAGAGAAIDGWSPDVVATTTAAVGPRIATLNRGIPHVPLSIFPQLYRLGAEGSPPFAPRFLGEVRAVSSADNGAGQRLLAWGVGAPGVLLHDRALGDLSMVPDDVEVVGYPYWDAVPFKAADLGAADEWLSDLSTPVVLVTLGSYARQTDTGRAVSVALRGSGVRVLSLNNAAAGRDPHVLSVGYIPVSRVVPRCAAVIHHGGLGTMFGALRAGRPSVVTPCAFDQAFNAALIEEAGVGLSSSVADLSTNVHRVLSRPRMTGAAEAVARALIPGDDAARRAGERILAASSTAI